MRNRGWRSVVAVIAAAWFLIASSSFNPPTTDNGVVLLELARPILVGLAILSLVLVDLDWAIEQARRIHLFA